MPRRNPYGWTFCPIASLTFAPVPVEPAGPDTKPKFYRKRFPAFQLQKSNYFAAFFAAAFLAGAFFAALFFAAVLAGFDFAAGASSTTFAKPAPDFFSATVTIMCASRR